MNTRLLAKRIMPSKLGKALALAITAAGLSLLAVNAHADQELHSRCVSFWDEYQSLSIKGTVKRIAGDTTIEEHSFVFNLSRAEGKQLPPWEILIMVPNPGEPHIDTDFLVDSAYAYDGSIYLGFQRKYISTQPIQSRLSTVSVDRRAAMPHRIRNVRKSVFKGLTEDDVTWNYGLPKSVFEKSSTLTVLRTGEFMGLPATEVRLSLNRQQDNATPVTPLLIDAWIALEPTFQMLQVTGVQAGSDSGADQELADIYMKSRLADSFQIMNSWLLCNRSRYLMHDGYWEVEINKAEPLAEGYVGFWDYSKVTGALFTGDAEKSTRKGSGRQSYAHTKEATFVPYSEEEMSKIRKYLLATTQPVQPKTNWTTVAFVAANVIAVGVLGWVGYRRYFTKRFAVWFFCFLAVSGPAQAADGLSEAEKQQPIAIPSLPLAVAADDGYCGIAAAEYVASRLPTQSNGCGGCRPGAVVT